MKRRAPPPVDIALRPPQWTVYSHPARFKSLVAGRRFGKSYLAIPTLVRWAHGLWRDGSDRQAWYVAPTYKQARRDLWSPLKRLARRLIRKANESTMTVDLIGGGRISLHGAENYDSLRGGGLNGLVLDEFADIDPRAWFETIRPMLSDRMGQALFIGTPKGFNHFYDLHNAAATAEGWAAFQYTTLQGGNVPASEIESARKDLDEKTFRQEYEASFESLFEGRAYYAFSRTKHVRAVGFNPQLPLCWSMDFNVDPMASVLCQIDGDEVRVLEEIVLRNSNTPAACKAFRDRAQKYLDALKGNGWATVPLKVRVYGDSAGNARKTSADRTDWKIVQDALRGDPSLIPSFHVPGSNPSVKARINAVNARLESAAGDVRMFIAPGCRDLVADLEQVAYDSSGDLDKSDPKRTHISDALGYLVEREFPLRQQGGPRPAVLI
jgi:hypothetical protein